MNLFDLVGTVIINGISVAEQQLQGISAVAEAAGKKIEKMGDKIEDTGRAINDIVGKPLMLLGGALGMATKEAVDFENQMLRVQAVTGANAQEMEMLSNQARELGKTTVFSAEEVATAMKDMGMAGWSTSQIMAGISPILDLAAASETDLAVTSKVVTGNINAFGLAAEDAAYVTDVLAKAAMDSKVDIDTLGESLRYGAPMANALGYSISEVAGIMGLFGDSNIGASQSGTTLNAVLRDLVKLSKKEAAPIFEELGIKTFDLQGNMKPLAEIIASIEKATANMTDEQKNSLLLMGFNEQALLGINVLLEKGSDKIAEYQGSLANASGEVKKMSDIIKQGAHFQIETFTSAVNELAIKMGTILLPILKDHILPALFNLLEIVDGIVSWFGRLSEETQIQILKWGAFLAILGPVLIVLGALVSAWGVLLQGFTLAVTAFNIIIKAMKSLAALFTITTLKVIAIVAALAGIGFLAYSIWEAWDDFKKAFGGIMTWIDSKLGWLLAEGKIIFLKLSLAVVDFINTTMGKLAIFEDVPFVGELFKKLSTKAKAATADLNKSIAETEKLSDAYSKKAGAAITTMVDGFKGVGNTIKDNATGIVDKLKDVTGFAKESGDAIKDNYEGAEEGTLAYNRALGKNTKTIREATEASKDHQGVMSQERIKALLAKKDKDAEREAREAARKEAEREKQAQEALILTYEDAMETDKQSIALMEDRLKVVDDDIEKLDMWNPLQKEKLEALNTERDALSKGIALAKASQVANEGIINSLKEERDIHAGAIQELENRSNALQKNMDILAKIGITSGKFINRLKEEKSVVDANIVNLKSRGAVLDDLDGKVARGEITLSQAVEMINKERKAIVDANAAINAHTEGVETADAKTQKWADRMDKLKEKARDVFKDIAKEVAGFVQGIAGELFADIEFGGVFTALSKGDVAGAFVGLFSGIAENSEVFSSMLADMSLAIGETLQVLLPPFNALFLTIRPMIPVVAQLLGIMGVILIDILTPLMPLLISIGDLMISFLTLLQPLFGPISYLLSQFLNVLVQWITALMPLMSPLVTILTILLQLLSPIIMLLGTMTPMVQLLADALGILLKPVELVAKAFDALLKPVEWLLNLLGGITKGGSNLLGGAVDFVGGVVGGVVDFAGDILDGIGGLFGFAEGGLVMGPTRALIGEGKDHEAVLPLNDDVLGYLGQQIAAATPQGGAPAKYSDMFQDSEKAELKVIIQLIGDNMMVDNSSLSNFAKMLWPKLKDESTRRGGSL